MKRMENNKDIVSDFLYGSVPVGGMPDSSIRIGVEFEVGGAYEDWGFIVEKNGKTISSGRSLEEAIRKAKIYLINKKEKAQ